MSLKHSNSQTITNNGYLSNHTARYDFYCDCGWDRLGYVSYCWQIAEAYTHKNP